MQLIILLYHYTGGSQNLQVYMLMRFLVSSYLFLNGYGHAMFAMKSNKHDIKSVTVRFSNVRTNIIITLLHSYVTAIFKIILDFRLCWEWTSCLSDYVSLQMATTTSTILSHLSHIFMFCNILSHLHQVW